MDITSQLGFLLYKTQKTEYYDRIKPRSMVSAKLKEQM